MQRYALLFNHMMILINRLINIIEELHIHTVEIAKIL